MTRLHAVLCGLWLIAAATRTHAQANAGRVLIVRTPHDARIVARLRAELRSAGWRTREIRGRAAGRRSLESLAYAYAVAAAMRVRPARFAVELWTAPQGDEASGRTDEVVVQRGPRADPGLLALRVAEVLRARGLGLPAAADTAAASGGSQALDVAGPSATSEAAASTEQQASGSGDEATQATATKPAAPPTAAGGSANAPAPPKPTSPARLPEHEPSTQPATDASAEHATPSGSNGTNAQQPVTPAHPTPPAAEPEASPPSATEIEPEQERSAEPPTLLALATAPALVYGPGGFPVSFDAYLELRIGPVPALSLSGFGLLPLATGRVRDADYGSTLALTYALGVSADLRLPVGPVVLSPGLGLAALLTVMGAHAVGGYETRDQTERTAAGLLRLAAAWRTAGALELWGGALVGLSLPRVQLQFAGKPIAHWGTPFFVFMLGARLDLR